MHFEVVADFACHTGECPVWHPAHKRLYWVDIPAGRLFSYDPATRHAQCVYETDVIGGLALADDGGLVLCQAEGRVQVWRDGDIAPLIDRLQREAGNRFNDALADPQGRLLAGTMAGPDGIARLYRIDRSGIDVLLDDIGQSNGMGFSPDALYFYHTDTNKRTITAYVYETMEPTGLVIESEKPDGLTVDADGFLWSAQWGGSCILRFSPNGELVDRFELPTQLVSSLIFGGDDYRDLYVTTAGGHERNKNGPFAGALFHCRSQFCGQPPRPVKLS